MREVVIGPLLLKTIPTYDAESSFKALKVTIELYLDLREKLATNELIKRTEAERYSIEYLNQILDRLKK